MQREDVMMGLKGVVARPVREKGGGSWLASVGDVVYLGTVHTEALEEKKGKEGGGGGIVSETQSAHKGSSKGRGANRTDPFAAPALLASPVEVADLGAAFHIGARYLAGKLARRDFGCHPVHLKGATHVKDSHARKKEGKTHRFKEIAGRQQGSRQHEDHSR